LYRIPQEDVRLNLPTFSVFFPDWQGCFWDWREI